MNTHAEPSGDGPGTDSDSTVPARRFDGPWLRVLATAATAWTLLYALDWFLLEAGTPAGAAVGFAHGYLLAPLATAGILLDALSLAERGVTDLGLFKWLYALVALAAPPIAIVYYAHREWLRPGDPDLLGGLR
ncbi:hypothetical protein C461_06254 [Halorubrum aidingense JCM 13560]|uniref:DUF3817 domain-containing protein n=1 Tax=Halorubrum aidingense JCM 13560 TaxID=1230454 RepID=M0PDP1_9EURY|nr:hypothetical protein [Halorubrum aidingense]EMA68161.1 hypothetical protein C461_06254 [Halorubrum aidingense JCM 13560]